MNWLKRNWMLLLGALLAVGALAGSIVFLLTQIRIEADYNTQAETYIKAYQDAIGARVYPNEANVQRAKVGAETFKSFSTSARQVLTVPPVAKTNSVGFKSLLENTIAELQAGASASAITVPPRYAFSFDAIRPMTTMPSNAIDSLTIQVGEVRDLANILIRSKVHQINSIRRVRVIADEGSGKGDYLDGLTTLQMAHVTITPYEISFNAVSAELSSVLDALQHEHTYYVVKKLTIDNLTSVELLTTINSAGTNSTATGTATNAAPVIGFPGANKTAPAPAASAAKGPAKPTGPITILDEKPFRATIFMEVVKAKPAS